MLKNTFKLRCWGEGGAAAGQLPWKTCQEGLVGLKVWPAAPHPQELGTSELKQVALHAFYTSVLTRQTNNENLGKLTGGIILQ